MILPPLALGPGWPALPFALLAGAACLLVASGRQGRRRVAPAAICLAGLVAISLMDGTVL